MSTVVDRRIEDLGPPTGTTERRGRKPRVEGEASSERIWAFLTPSERHALQHVADATGVQIATLVREAVNEYVADFCERQIFSATGNSKHPVS